MPHVILFGLENQTSLQLTRVKSIAFVLLQQGLQQETTAWREFPH